MFEKTWSRSTAFPLSKLSHSAGGNCGIDLLQLSNDVRALLASREKFSSRAWVFCNSGDRVEDELKNESSGSFHGNLLVRAVVQGTRHIRVLFFLSLFEVGVCTVP
jgi:hypothetical protein